jgi:hypothetical protein
VTAGLIARVATSPPTRAALRCGVLIAAVLLFLLSIRRAGERTGRLQERLETMEKTNDFQREMPEAAARRLRRTGNLWPRNGCTSSMNEEDQIGSPSHWTRL